MELSSIIYMHAVLFKEYASIAFSPFTNYSLYTKCWHLPVNTKYMYMFISSG